MKTIDEVSEFHGHMCPGLALGYRVAQYAVGRLGGARAEDEELLAIVENDSCAVDAVQVLTGCTFGKGNLFYRDYGKQVYTFMRRPKGEALRIAVNWTPPKDTPEEAALWERYSRGERSEEVIKAVHSRKSRKIESIMKAPDEELFSVSTPAVELPPEASIHRSITCAECGEKAMESRARLLQGRTLCMPCFMELGG